MILKTYIHVLASFLLLSTLVISQDEELLESAAIAKVPAQSPPILPPVPVNLPPTAAPIPVKIPPPQAPVPIKVPPPPVAPVPVKVPPPPPQVQIPPSPSVKPPPPIKQPPVPAPPVSPPHPPPPRNTKECYPPCVVRCKLHSRKNVCLRACVTCCDRCKCVPPGQYGNKEMCGKCYVNMTTHGGKSKCP